MLNVRADVVTEREAQHMVDCNCGLQHGSCKYSALVGSVAKQLCVLLMV
jgi:hypothetical protein